jgi:dTMP kinase
MLNLLIGVKMTLKIEFEGTDGAGKTTGLKYFISQAQKLGMKVTETREVGNPHVPSCVKMREFVLDPKSDLSGEAMELIFSAMRIESDTWLNNLKNSPNSPDLVVSDRGFFSHLSYGLHNTSEAFVTGLFENLMAKQTSLPNVVIYFDVNTETALKRRVKRGEAMDVIEMKGVPYQDKVREAFGNYLEKYAKQEQITVYKIDANQDIKGVQDQLDMILHIIGLKPIVE